MLVRVLTLLITAICLLTTSFCVHQNRKRKPTSACSAESYGDPIVIEAQVSENEMGKVIIHRRNNEGHGEAQSLLVQYMCSEDSIPVDHALINISRFEGTSARSCVPSAYSWRELSQLLNRPIDRLIHPTRYHDLQSVVVIKFRQIPSIEFLAPANSRPEGISQIKLDLAALCSS